jgi:hypothetical protein
MPMPATPATHVCAGLSIVLKQPVVHRAFGFNRGAPFLFCTLATDFEVAAFARARAALLAAARLSVDHGVY